MRRYALLLLLLLAPSSRADTIILLNGNEINGTIEDVEADTIVLIVPGGKLSFEHTEIQEMDLNDKKFKSGPGAMPEDAAESAEEASPTTPSIVDLPPPNTDEERNRRRDMLITSISKVALNPEEAPQAELDRIDDYAKALGQLGPAAAPQIEDIFHNGNIRLAGPMLEALHVADPARAEALAKEALAHDHPDARAAAITILAASSDKEKAAVLATALNDPRAPNQVAALKALAAAQDPAATDAILNKLNTADEPAVQAEAVAALQSITGQSFSTPEEWANWAATR